MGREKKLGPGAATGAHAKERHKRAKRVDNNEWAAPLPAGLVARPTKPVVKSKHQSYFEIVENKDKKKKLEFQVTCDRNPPPGFEFVPVGNPELTRACKELSREQDAMIFIVSTSHDKDPSKLALHLHRIGHHIRQTIVEQARAAIGQDESSSSDADLGVPEPIPESQDEINAQADAALKDLFPRIPNFDRQMVIEHAFKKGGTFGGEPVVGMAADIPLSRRVQLAVLAHIRHNHTRYDKLLRETSYINARRAVEALCLDILVKWRGDEETGRDQLDEILREVVVISDDSDDSDEDDEESSVESISEPGDVTGPAVSTTRRASQATSSLRQQRRQQLSGKNHAANRSSAQAVSISSLQGVMSAKSRPPVKKAQRGFKRFVLRLRQFYYLIAAMT
ncbi:alanine and arginine rich protein [Pleurostoma richardsiae]|uniref:Alanine and arginine rich protein n=1 Tax=Pleurostoma richardsiae TaxID=41990 RepID=A0AA38RBB4_9PEZI|nr:alanine and arginine rich protein [Pleurostoma richardsiae]